MRKFLAAALAIGMIVSLSVTAFALDWETDEENDIVLPGRELRIYTSNFEDEDGSSPGMLDSARFTLSATWKKGKNYIERTYFEDDDDFITVLIKPNLNLGRDAALTGTFKIRYRDEDRETTVYTLTISDDDELFITSVDNAEKTYMERVSDKQFCLPYDYMEKTIRFITDDDDKERVGTFTGEFSNGSGTDIAKYVVKVVEQSPLYLGFSENVNNTVAKKYPNADLRFVTWTAAPT